jgi:histone-lysine N-methyltransferase SETD8
LINHSRKNPNLETKLYVVEGKPHLGLVAISDIGKGTEVLYDYGERDPAAVAAHPWLADA